MKLYYSPGACSLSPHIALHEAGLPFEAVLASTKSHKLQDGTDYYTINPKGYVPLLEFDDGTRLAKARPSCNGSPTRCRRRSSRLRPARWSATACRSGSRSSAPRSTSSSARCSTLPCPKRPSRCSAEDPRQAGLRGPAPGSTRLRAQRLHGGRRLPLHRGAMDRAAEARHLRPRELNAFMARMRARPAVQRALKAEGLAG